MRSLSGPGSTFVYSGLVETRSLGWLRQPERWSYMMSPVLAYRPSVQPADAFIIPFDFNTAGQEYLERLIVAQIMRRDSIAVVTRQFSDAPAWLRWVSERLKRAGFRPTRGSAYGNVRVEVFQRLSH